MTLKKLAEIRLQYHLLFVTKLLYFNKKKKGIWKTGTLWVKEVVSLECGGACEFIIDSIGEVLAITKYKSVIHGISLVASLSVMARHMQEYKLGK